MRVVVQMMELRVTLTIFVCKKLKAVQMERVGDWIRVGPKSNMMRVLIRRGRFGHRDIDTWGEDSLGG